MINDKKGFTTKILILFLVTIIMGVVIFVLYHKTKFSKKDPVVVMVGLPKEHVTTYEKIFTEESRKYFHLEKGNQLLKNNEIDEAIKEFNVFLNMADSFDKGLANECLADAYERKRDYTKALAYARIVLEKYTNDQTKESVAERVKYLEYALRGEYDLAVEHALKYLETEFKMPNTPKEVKDYFQQQVNDLIAAKDYILSLKKKE